MIPWLSNFLASAAVGWGASPPSNIVGVLFSADYYLALRPKSEIPKQLVSATVTLTPISHTPSAIIPRVAEDNGKEEEKFDFTPEGEGYISLAEARVLATRTALEAPGDYGRQYQGVAMAFEVADSGEDEDSLVSPSTKPHRPIL
jgi:hypothetical protein